MKEKHSQHRQGGLAEGKGFYIVLFLCVAAIGVSGYYLFSSLAAPVGGFGEEPATVVSGEANITQPTLEPTATNADKTPETTPQSTIPQSTPAPRSNEDTVPSQKTKSEPSPAPVSEDQEDAAPDEAAAAAGAYVWPVQGQVDRDFSLEVFAYDETMGDWRTHSGLDIAAQVGAPVSACAGGTVSEVTTDAMLGKTVKIDHGMGTESVYANLAEDVNVKVGDTVQAGDVLGAVGSTARAESASPSHLHFELSEYGVTIDPLNYLH